MNIEELINDSSIDKIKSSIDRIGKIQSSLVDLYNSDDPNKLKTIKIGTTLTIAALKKKAQGVAPSEYTKQDWEDVLGYVSDIAISSDGSVYSMYVFDLYADYIRYSANVLAVKISDEKAGQISGLADELDRNKERFQDDEITETKYIEENLWICLEGMIKLMASTIDACLGLQKEQLFEAVATFAFEYGRLALYKREQALLDEYLENQKILDVELAMKYEAYMEELNERSAQMERLIENAFNPEMRSSLKNSVLLARAAGVKEDEILKDTNDIDAFFMA